MKPYPAPPPPRSTRGFLYYFLLGAFYMTCYTIGRTIVHVEWETQPMDVGTVFLAGWITACVTFFIRELFR
jgi:hypothetical protein